jgi:hypothetical protein
MKRRSRCHASGEAAEGVGRRAPREGRERGLLSGKDLRDGVREGVAGVPGREIEEGGFQEAGAEALLINGDEGVYLLGEEVVY